MSDTSTRAELRCTDCGRGVEICACCERDECDHAVCSTDLAFVLGQSIPQPHGHGG